MMACNNILAVRVTLLASFLGVISGQSCRKGSDVVFLLHSSPSISKTDFGRYLNFVTTLIPKLNLNNGITKVGFLYYSGTNNKVSYSLNSFSNSRTAVDAISQVRHVRSADVSLGAAVEEVQVRMFSGSSGDRQVHANVVVLLSDGEYRRDSTVLSRIQALKQTGVMVITVALGKWVSKSGMEVLASVPQDKNFYHAKDYQEFISDTLNDVRDALCDENNECWGAKCGTGECLDSINAYRCSCEAGSTGRNCDYVCTAKMDLVIAVDASGSIGSDNFRMVQQYVRNVVYGVGVGQGSRVGLAAFSTTTQVIYHLNRYPTTTGAVNGVGIPYMQGTTNTAGVLRLVREDMFNTERGDRQANPNVLILITDGKSNNRTETLQEAAAVRNSGIHVVVVGIGDSLNIRELNAIASYPNEKNLFLVSRFGGLLSTPILVQVLDTVCNNENDCQSDSCLNGAACVDGIKDFSCECPTGYSGKDCKRRCNNLADVVFVVDSSSAIQRSDFYRVTDTLRQVVSHWDVSPDRTRIAVVHYSTKAQVLFHFDEYTSQNEVLNAMLFIPHVGGETNTTDAIRVIREEVFREDKGDRAFIPNFAILITGRPPTVSKDETVPQAVRTRIEGTLMYVITLHELPLQPVDELRMRGVSSEPHQYFRLNMTGPDELKNRIDEVVGAICNDVNDCGSSPCLNEGRCFDSLHYYTCDCDERFTGIHCERECTRQIDLAFLVDLSGSIYTLVPTLQKLVQAIVRRVNFAVRRTRVALVSFNGDASILFDLNSHGAKEEVVQAITLHHIGQGSNIASALRTIGRDIFTSSAGDRDGVDDFLVVITDGRATEEVSRTGDAAEALRSRDITIFTIGVGERINKEVIESISGDRGSSLVTQVHMLESETDVEKVANSITDQICF